MSTPSHWPTKPSPRDGPHGGAPEAQPHGVLGDRELVVGEFTGINFYFKGVKRLAPRRRVTGSLDVDGVRPSPRGRAVNPGAALA